MQSLGRLAAPNGPNFFVYFYFDIINLHSVVLNSYYYYYHYHYLNAGFAPQVLRLLSVLRGEHIYIYIYTHMHTQIHIHTLTRYMHIYIYCACRYIYIYIYIYMCIDVRAGEAFALRETPLWNRDSCMSLQWDR